VKNVSGDLVITEPNDIIWCM